MVAPGPTADKGMKAIVIPDEFMRIKYSWWSYRAGARAKNVGWRIDYFLTSPPLLDRIKHVDILDDVVGSDHCPVLLDLK